MRDFLINSEELLDTRALAFVNGQGADYGLFPCFWIHYNERIKLAFFPERYRTLGEATQDMDLNEVTKAAQALLARVSALSEHEEISLENVIWDTDSIYLDDGGQVYLIAVNSSAGRSPIRSSRISATGRAFPLLWSSGLRLSSTTKVSH